MRKSSRIGKDSYIYSDYKPVYNNEVLQGYDKAYDIEAIKQSLINLFVIAQYEVPGKPEFGNPLNIRVFELFDKFEESIIESSIRTLVTNYEPRVLLDDVRVTAMEELNRLIVEIDYFVIIDNNIVGDTITLPFMKNSRSWIDARGSTYNQQKTIGDIS